MGLALGPLERHVVIGVDPVLSRAGRVVSDEQIRARGDRDGGYLDSFSIGQTRKSAQPEFRTARAVGRNEDLGCLGIPRGAVRDQHGRWGVVYK